MAFCGTVAENIRTGRTAFAHFANISHYSGVEKSTEKAVKSFMAVSRQLLNKQ